MAITPEGAMIALVAHISRPRFQVLQQSSTPVPVPVVVRGLIDTGASCTCVDPSVMARLHLTPTGSTLMDTPSTNGAPVQVNQYDMSFLLPDPGGSNASKFLENIPVAETALSSQGFDALIGRDILAHCVLIYNGTFGFYTLSF